MDHGHQENVDAATAAIQAMTLMSRSTSDDASSISSQPLATAPFLMTLAEVLAQASYPALDVSPEDLPRLHERQFDVEFIEARNDHLGTNVGSNDDDNDDYNCIGFPREIR